MRPISPANKGFTLLEVSITLLIISILIGCITVWAMELQGRNEDRKLLAGHRELVETLMETFQTVQTPTTAAIQVTPTAMPDFLQDHGQVVAPYQIRNIAGVERISIKQSPNPVLITVNLGASGNNLFANGRNIKIVYTALPNVLCHRLYLQELDINCGQSISTANLSNFNAMVNGNVVNSCDNYKSQPEKSGCSDLTFTYSVPIQ